MKAKISSWSGKKVLVVGLGLHGGAASAIRWLIKRGAIIIATDIKSSRALRSTIRQLRGLPIKYHLGGHRRGDFLWADAVYQNQGVPNRLPGLTVARRRRIPIINEVTLFFEQCPAPIIGLTGTRGKSTTTALLAAILKNYHPLTVVSGNIRQTPMLDWLDRLTPRHWVVLELSSFQLEFLPRVKRGPNLAVMLNLKVDHLNRYPSLAAYARAKYNIFRFQTKRDQAVLNHDCPWTRAAAKLTLAKIWWFSRQPLAGSRAVWKDGYKIVSRENRRVKQIVNLKAWPLPGTHQEENLLGAVTAARALGVPIKHISSVVKKFTGLPHRQQLVRRWRGHRFINDTTATTPDGTLAALAVFPQAVFILGGADKALRFRALVQVLQRRRQPLILLPGAATDKIIGLLARTGFKHPIWKVNSMAAAVQRAVRIAEPGQDIVLSPGAASFGLFQHEFDRGQQFIAAVKKL